MKGIIKMNDVIVKTECCFGFFEYTNNITQGMDENDHDMILLIDGETLSSLSKPLHFCSVLYDYGTNGFHVMKHTLDGSCQVSMIYCNTPDGRRLLSSHCMINGKGYQIEEDFSIHKDLVIGETLHDYMVVCKIITPRKAEKK